MSYAPISKFLPQWTDPATGLPYSGAVLKAYKDGTSTVLSMATDYTGGTTATSMALNSGGYPEVSGNEVIPHVNEDYKLALYANQAAADANSGALWTIDTIPVGSFFQTMTNHVKSEVFFIEDDVGAGSTAFDIDAVIGAAWESVGPTGSGATNIWTAMDNIPDGAAFVEIMIYNYCTDTANGQLAQYVYGRVTGSSTSIGVQAMKSAAYCPLSTDDDSEALDLVSRKIPIDSSKRFDLYLVTDGTSRTVDMYLVGAGI